MNPRSILTSTAALAALALAACSSPDSGQEAETAQVADSSPAATESTEDWQDDAHWAGAPEQPAESDSTPLSERPESAGPPSESSGRFDEDQETAWEYSDEIGWYEYPVNVNVDHDAEPETFSGPEIDAPYVETCPYHEEVGQVEGSIQDKIDKALELGCEMGIHGDITFEQPIDAPPNSDGTYGFTSVEDALSIPEMCEQGYIPEDDQWCDPDFEGH